MIGGLAPGDGNTIAFNNATGILVRAGSSRIRGNSIHSNGGLGIDLTPGAAGLDLAPDGVTDNDTTDGDFGTQGPRNFPVLSSASLTADGLLVRGSLMATSPSGLSRSTCSRTRAAIHRRTTVKARRSRARPAGDLRNRRIRTDPRPGAAGERDLGHGDGDGRRRIDLGVLECDATAVNRGGGA